MGLWPKIWAKTYWDFLYLVCKKHGSVVASKDPAISDGDKTQMKDDTRTFLKSFPGLLLCPFCIPKTRVWMAQEENQPPIDETEDTNAMFKWAVKFHNAMKANKHKPDYTLEESEKYFHDEFFEGKKLSEMIKHERELRHYQGKIDALEAKVRQAEAGGFVFTKTPEEEKKAEDAPKEQPSKEDDKKEEKSKNTFKIVGAIVAVLVLIVIVLFFVF